MVTGPVLVCLKWVSLRPEIDPLTGLVATDERFSGASPADLAALEWALQLSAHGPAVVVATLASGRAEPMLRQALASGASGAIRIEQGEDDRPSAAVAVQLAGLATDLEASLVITGDHSLDRGSGSVPAFLAAELGWPQALGLISAHRDGPQLVVERRLDQGRRERLTIGGPAVISFEAGITLRRASLNASLDATTASIDVRPLTIAGPPIAPLRLTGYGPYHPRTNVKPAPVGTTRERLLSLSGSHRGEVTARIFAGSPEEAAALAHNQLVEWGYIQGAADESNPARG